MTRPALKPRILVCACALLCSAAFAAGKVAVQTLPAQAGSDPSFTALTSGDEALWKKVSWPDAATALSDPAQPNDAVEPADPTWLTPLTGQDRSPAAVPAQARHAEANPSPATMLFGALLVGAWMVRQLIQRPAARTKPRSLRA